MSYQLQATPARRPSWRGILAGLLMGLVVWFAMFSLALILSSFLSLDLQGASITGGIYTIVTALLSAFTAGYFAVKASAPEALFGDGVEILPKDATLIGMLTAASIVVITTWLAVSGLTSAAQHTTKKRKSLLKQWHNNNFSHEPPLCQTLTDSKKY